MLDQLIEIVAGQGPSAVARAAVEIAILTYLVYQLFREIRGGRAVPVALGVLILFGAYFGAGLLGFSTIETLLAGLRPYLGLALIVVFQTEIRSALRELALRFVPAGRNKKKVYYELEDVIYAITQLTQTKTGALIVLERETGLRTYVQSGVALDARLTSDLLVSIFQRSSPLHDGGVIIQSGRIAAAACFLPLTTSPSLAATLGTRHRAAIGVSEESDALVVVVSETDGRISLALGGEIERGVTLDRLRLRMIEQMGPVVSPPRGTPVAPAEPDSAHPSAEAPVAEAPQAN